jgi:hypothetical protein
MGRRDGSRCMPHGDGSRCMPHGDGSRCMPHEDGSRCMPHGDGSHCMPHEDGSRCMPHEDVFIMAWRMADPWPWRQALVGRPHAIACVPRAANLAYQRGLV